MCTPVEATCTEPGISAGLYCSACGEVFDIVEAPAKGHTMVNGICTECGYEEK